MAGARVLLGDPVSFIHIGEASLLNTVFAARHAYAEELRVTTHMRSSSLYAAFAAVPRERFLGPGPWRIKSSWDLSEYWTTEDANPKHIYHDVLVAIDEALGLNNGQPSLWAYLFDQLSIARKARVLHLGCGTGYYTALLAELVGTSGTVTAIDIHTEVVRRAAAALAPWPQVAVKHADGATVPLEQADVIVASAGATHPLPPWLDALAPAGRLLFPMTPSNGTGGMLLVTRLANDEMAARFLCPATFYEFSGARDLEAGERLERSFARGRAGDVQSLRRDDHAEDGTCWLHGTACCLSRRAPR
jgi:protein-L-isoaspartate(D-aspartate) O-methyltransferase